MEIKSKIVFSWVQGGISSTLVSEKIEEINKLSNTGAIELFLGQIRADAKEQQTVVAIDYTAYEEMADEQIRKIIEPEIAEKYALTAVMIFHSLGRVNVGEISLLVIVAAPHRKAVFEACHEIVEKIKKEVPIWGEELLDNQTRIWKKNN